MLLFSDTFPPMCDSFDVTHTLSEDTINGTCFSITTNCNDPVDSETLTYAAFTGNGTTLFTLNNQVTTNLLLQICTHTNLKGSYGVWGVSLSPSLINSPQRQFWNYNHICN